MKDLIQLTSIENHNFYQFGVEFTFYADCIEQCCNWLAKRNLDPFSMSLSITRESPFA